MASLQMAARAASSSCDELFSMSRGSSTVDTGNIYSRLDAKIIDNQVQIYSNCQLYEDKIGIFFLNRG
jgi:hypothetical protein